MVFVVSARVEAKLEHYEAILEKARAIAKYVEEEELETFTYQWSLKKEDDKVYFYIFERFSSEEYFRKVHCDSPLFHDFFKFANENEIVIRNEESEQADFGYMFR